MEYHAVFSRSYRVPVLYLCLLNLPAPYKALSIDTVYDLLVPSTLRTTLGSVGVMGGISFAVSPWAILDNGFCAVRFLHVVSRSSYPLFPVLDLSFCPQVAPVSSLMMFEGPMVSTFGATLAFLVCEIAERKERAEGLRGPAKKQRYEHAEQAKASSETVYKKGIQQH